MLLFSRALLASTAFALSCASANAFDRSKYNSPRYDSPEMDTMKVQSEGSTGPISGMSVKPTGLNISRSLAERFGERPSVIDYGVDMTGVADSSSKLANALNSGRPITAPCGTIRLVSTVNVTVRTFFQGAGACTHFKYDAPAGVPAAPLLNVRASAEGSHLSSFSFDHQAQIKAFTPAVIYGDNIIASSAILVQADNTTLTDITGANAYDNCIAVTKLPDVADGDGEYKSVAGMPKGYSLQRIRTSGCGVGTLAGGGVDIGSGSAGIVDSLVDTASYGAFILDIGAGAQGAFSNLTSIGNLWNPSVPAVRSQSFYIGQTDSTFTNLTSIDAQDRAMWIDGNAKRNALTNVYLKTSANEALTVSGSNNLFTNVSIESPGYGRPSGTMDAVRIDTTPGPLTGLQFVNLNVYNSFNAARYGVNVIGGNGASGSIFGLNAAGAASATNNIPSTFSVIDGTALGAGWNSYTPTVACGAPGSFGAVSATGSTRKVGKTVDYNVIVSFTSMGSCPTLGAFSLPYPSAARTSVTGLETAAIGYSASGVIQSGFATISAIRRVDNLAANVGGDGQSIVFSGTYQAQ